MDVAKEISKLIKLGLKVKDSTIELTYLCFAIVVNAYLSNNKSSEGCGLVYATKDIAGDSLLESNSDVIGIVDLNTKDGLHMGINHLNSPLVSTVLKSCVNHVGTIIFDGQCATTKEASDYLYRLNLNELLLLLPESGVHEVWDKFFWEDVFQYESFSWEQQEKMNLLISKLRTLRTHNL